MKTQKVWFVTGAAKGFGLEIAKAALESGDQVVATVRSKLEQLAAALHNHPDLCIVQMDVTEEDQIQEAVKQGVARFGRLDVVVNNAAKMEKEIEAWLPVATSTDHDLALSS